MQPRVAFVGLGIMGHSMAGHLLAAGYSLTVYTRTKARADDLLARGATWADSPANAARDAHFVFVCVPDTPDVKKVMLGEDGVLKTLHSGQIVIDHSTISPSATRELAAEVAKHGGQFLDAPVSGGDTGARNATLSIMVGGEASAFNETLPLFQKMGKTITHCGATGTGQLTKLVNQILVAVTNLAVSEALNFARANGLDDQKTLDAVSGGAAASWQLSNLGPRMLKGDFAPGFMIKLQQKDLRLALAAAEEQKLHLRATGLVHELFDQAMKEGRGEQGTQALFEVCRENL
jgi:3-hydroxyisobutyrate dehydrogenase-like beta-hydroxyacid dehydrogenase